MSEEKTSTRGSASDTGKADTWREVGENFKSLGESLAAAFKDTLGNEEVKQKLRASMDSLAAGINDAVKEAADSEHAQQVRGEVEKAAKSAHEASKQTYQDIRPHIVSSLRQLSVELHRMIDRLEREEEEGTSDRMDVT